MCSLKSIYLNNFSKAISELSQDLLYFECSPQYTKKIVNEANFYLTKLL